MKKALILTVGTGTRPDVNIVNPLVKTIRNSNPNFVVLLCSEVSAPIGEQIIVGAGLDGQQCQIHCLSDEDNLEMVCREANRIIRSVKDRGFASKDIDVDFTSGTKAMTGGLVLSAIFNSCATLKYITGERKNGIVQDGTERFLSVEPTAIFALEDIKTAASFIFALRFDAALELLEGVNPAVLDNDMRSVVRSLTTIATAYSHWDKFDHLKYAGEYSKTKFDFEELKKYRIEKESLGTITQIGKDIQAGRITENIVCDLFNNALRRLDEGKYDDALARFYRTTEMFAQWILEMEYDIITGDVDIDKVPKRLQNSFEAMRDKREDKIQIGLKKSYLLLKEIGNPIGETYLRNKKIQGLLNQRNNSIFAHGVQPIVKEACESLCRELQDLLSLKIEQFQDKCKALEFPWRQNLR